ncbi:hypothetical protein V6N12_068555 [Hibiscus sabdariffa]|uniref:Uncharacterized protein n=1 Tax=Hibiscus sabdariffa TaxID=183260 RepID=A0ABR2FQC9_9ROSI
MVPLTTNASSESIFGTLCLMQTLLINKGKKRLIVPFLMHLNASSTMMCPTLIFRPVTTECKKAIRSSEMVSLCDVGIKLAFKKWFQPLAGDFNASLLIDRLHFSETIQVVPVSHKSAKILFLFVVVMEFTKTSF